MGGGKIKGRMGRDGFFRRGRAGILPGVTELRAALGKSLEILASMTVGLALFGLIAVAGIVGSINPGLGEAVYGSWWFTALLLGLVLNTGLCAVSRRPGIGRQPGRAGFRGWSVFGIHVAMLLIAVASLWASLAFSTDRVEVGEGESFEVEGRQVTFDSLRVERYPDGSVSDWVSRIEAGSGPADIRVNHPATVGSTRILLAGHSRDFVLALRLPMDAEATSTIIPEGAYLPLSKDGSIILTVEAAPEGSPGKAIARVVLSKDGKPAVEALASEGITTVLGSTGVEVTVTATRAVSVFILRRTPGIGFLWAAFAILSLAVCGYLLAPAKKGAARKP